MIKLIEILGRFCVHTSEITKSMHEASLRQKYFSTNPRHIWKSGIIAYFGFHTFDSTSSSYSVCELLEQGAKRTMEVELIPLRKLLDFYFSDNNLCKDSFLRGKIEESEEGWVMLDLLMTFNK